MLFDELGRPVRRTASVVRHIDLRNTVSLAPGTAENNLFTIPPNQSWLGRRLVVMASAPPGATAGNHIVELNIPGSFVTQSLLWLSAAHGASLGHNAEILAAAIGGSRSLQLVYHNSTNVAQTNPRSWHITVLEEMS
jgi:hypothetical protein